jgi:hypothetical protein
MYFQRYPLPDAALESEVATKEELEVPVGFTSDATGLPEESLPVLIHLYTL